MDQRQAKRQWPARELLLMAGILFAAWCWLFLPTLLSDRNYAFRDSGHYYYPLHHELATQQADGQSPLWNAYENLGQPLLGDATAGSYYPPTWLLHLVLPHQLAYKLNIALHFAACLALALLCTRLRGHSYTSSGIAALSYTFSGYVLLQHANPVFLVSATWLPPALLCGHALLNGRGGALAVLGLAASLALQVLGGDPHTAAHIVLVLAISALFFARRETDTVSSSHASPAQRSAGRWSFRVLLSRWTLLGAAAVVALAMSVVQVVPAARWVSATTRAVTESPRSVWETLAAPRVEQDDARWRSLVAPPASDNTHQQLYHFSVPPWRLVELAWPNFSGRMYPQHQRWTQSALNEQRIWTPTLYCGWIPLVLAIVAFRFRGGSREQRWLSWLAVAVFLAACGQYGLGWIAQFLGRQLGQAPDVGTATGGLYWWLVVTLPGYSMFRYPAKWLVIFAWAISQLAAIGWDRMAEGQAKPPRRLLSGMLVISTLALIVMLAIRSWWIESLQAAATIDSIFGPLQVRGAWWDVVGSLAQNGVLCGAALLLWRKQFTSALPAMLILFITAVDLIAASSWQLVTAPSHAWQYETSIHAALAREQPRIEWPVRVYRSSGWRPVDWARRSDYQRLTDVIRWDRATLFPKHHLLFDVPRIDLLEASGSMRSADHASLMRVAAQMSPVKKLPHPELLAALGVEYLVLPVAFRPEAYATEIPLNDPPVDCRLWRISGTAQRAWVVQDVEVVAPPTRRDPQSLDRQTRDVLFPDGRLRDLSQEAVVESRSWSPPVRSSGGELDFDCNIRWLAGDELVVDVWQSHAGLLVVAEAFDPGWQAIDEQEGQPPQPLEVLRVNRVLRGVWLPAGRHRVVFRYRPTAWPLVAWISLLAWCGGGATVVLVFRRFRRQRTFAVRR